MQGNLYEFSLSELLQLFALSEKSGAITVWRDDLQFRLFLEAGRLAGCGRDDYDAHAAILKCRFLPQSTETALRSIVPDTGSPGLAFIVQNLVGPARWASFTRRLLEQEVYPLLECDNGRFEVDLESDFTVPVRIDMSIQQLILDGSRWEADNSKLTLEGYGADSSWQRTDPIAKDRPIELSDSEWVVLSALTTTSELAQIGANLCLPQLEVAETLKNLHNRGLVTALLPANRA